MTRPGVLVALVVVLATVSAGAAGAADGHGEQPAALQTSDVETDAVVLRADVRENGDAAWTIEYRVRLDDQNTTDAFESLDRDVANNTTAYRDQFANRMQQTVGAAESATGREMAVSNASVSTRTTYFGKRYGVVSYQFVWEGFAQTDGDRLVIGDALAGFFLDNETKLTVSWPDGYERESVDPAGDESGERSVTWVGPTEFSSGEPRILVAPTSPLPISPYYVVPVVLLLVAAAGGGVWYRRRETVDRPGGTGVAGGESPVAAGTGGATSAGAEDTTGDSTPADPDGQGSTGRSGDGTSADGVSDGGGGDGTDDHAGGATSAPEELLSPEERVMRLIHDRGGRMKQKTVTEELDWSAARTSQVVGNLRDDGKVESFRLGRENVLKLPDEDDGA